MNNNKRATKRALLTSVMALVMCVVMLVGTTFAWFTDTASTGVNKIQAGNLDIELAYKDSTMEAFKLANRDTPVFNENALWEPGHVEYVVLKVSNAGNLALKYKLGINIASETGSKNVDGKDFKLSNYIKFAVLDGDRSTEGRDGLVAAATDSKLIKEGYTAEDHLLKDGSKVVTLVVWMPTTVGNEANHMTGKDAPVINLGISVAATQYTYEKDSFDDQYDKDAPANVTTAADATAIAAAIEKAKNDGVPVKIVLSGDVSDADLNGGDVTVDVADKTLKIKSDPENNAPTISDGSVTIIGADDSKLGNYKIVVDSAVLTIGVGLADSNSYQAVPFEVKNGGTLNITKGDNSSDGYQSMLVKASDAGTAVNISGGTFASNGSEAIFVAANDGAVVNVSGGAFSGSGASSCVFYANGGTIIISDCTASSFAGRGTQMFKAENGGKIVVTGGTFAADPSAYVDLTTHIVTNTNGTYTVTAK